MNLTRRTKLFKGKNEDDEWVTGYLVYCKSVYDKLETDRVADIIPVDTDRIYLGEYSCHNCESVDPDTVVQFLNRRDRNNQMVFEGDIVNIYNAHMGLTCEPVRGVIVERDTIIVNGLGRHFQDTKEYEVIGNIYDNFELLDDKSKLWCKNYWFGESI